MRSIELKIKSKHLAIEAKIIRAEELKLKTTRPTNYIDKINSLSEHRKSTVRYEARATHLARTYLAHHEYSSVEKSRKSAKEYYFVTKVLPKVVSMVNKYGDTKVSADQIKSWTEGQWLETTDKSTIATKAQRSKSFVGLKGMLHVLS